MLAKRTRWHKSGAPRSEKSGRYFPENISPWGVRTDERLRFALRRGALRMLLRREICNEYISKIGFSMVEADMGMRLRNNSVLSVTGFSIYSW